MMHASSRMSRALTLAYLDAVPSSYCCARSSLIISPVLILTGHLTWHMPSAAQVWEPWYLYTSSSSSSLQSVTLGQDTSVAREACG